mmetsp:Transcript_38441/g.63701  ORF Transcript_38441/g.63701 Transcript_38441/m.63701 type:complete len:199 (-) Transcript_38441:322-918(-)|eukprot:CAMPEP_0119298944 /NCGR_PEP_ID=MMETSP1333-20130426/1079_1 /TAXON_ID=418940 /ORGANISM="Scyphosphaera apsteinii, Strain RCC1455" /LENGTH=198 /DNA_ID=CAMNT_0007300199 /DNA_START=99 /DNA_END=695 /DNA_ORIENTATION=+
MMASALPPSAPLQILLVLVGIPGSGKSTFARRVIADATAMPMRMRWQRISQDVLGSRGSCIAAAQCALDAGDHLIIDRCNFNVLQREHWLNLRGAAGAHCVAVFLDVPQHEALRRVLGRLTHEGGVDSDSMSERKIRSIIARMYNDLCPPQLVEGFDEVHVCRSDEPEFSERARGRLGDLFRRADARFAAYQQTASDW